MLLILKFDELGLFEGLLLFDEFLFKELLFDKLELVL